MKKQLIILLYLGMFQLVAGGGGDSDSDDEGFEVVKTERKAENKSSDSAIAEPIWLYNLDASNATRTNGGIVTIFNITRERSIDPQEVLPADAEVGIWYPILRAGTLNLQAPDSGEKIDNHPFQVLVCELKYEMVDGATTIHAHYGEAYKKVSQFKKKTFYKCWACEGTEQLLRILKRTPDNTEEIIVNETLAGVKHTRKDNIQEFTNPESQDYGTGKITAASGSSGVNRQVVENTLKGLFKKVGI